MLFCYILHANQFLKCLFYFYLSLNLPEYKVQIKVPNILSRLLQTFAIFKSLRCDCDSQ